MNCEKRWKDMTKRIGWIDNLKGVAILLVVIRHVMQANITDCSQTIIGNAIFAVQMPLFMIIAGYFSITSDKYYSSKTEIWNYIKKRLMHYILPFFSWYIVVYVLLRGFYNRNVFEALKILVNNVDVGLWFLYVVFVLSVVMVIAKAICTRLKFPSKTGILPILTGGYPSSAFATRTNLRNAISWNQFVALLLLVLCIRFFPFLQQKFDYKSIYVSKDCWCTWRYSWSNICWDYLCA